MAVLSKLGASSKSVFTKVGVCEDMYAKLLLSYDMLTSSSSSCDAEQSTGQSLSR